MATYTGTSADNSWTLVTPGTFSLDGLDGVDTLYMGTSLRSSYVFSKSSDGAVHVDSISGASGVLHATLYNMEVLVFDSKRDTMDLRTYFANNLPTGTLTILGSPTQGQKLTAKSTLGDADGMGALTYQWLADGVAINNATASTLVLSEAQVGKAITLKVNYTDGRGTAESVTSGATDAVANTNDLPVGTVSIAGLAVQGQALNASNDLTDADGIGNVSYQWFADQVALAGQNASTLALTEAQVGKKITVQAAYLDGHGTSEKVLSSETLVVENTNDAPTGSVKITGALRVGSTIAADASTLADLDGLGPLTYQWKADQIDIANASQSDLVLTPDLIQKRISLHVSYTDGHGFVETMDSAQTAAVVDNSLPVILDLNCQIHYWSNPSLHLPAVQVAMAGHIQSSDNLGVAAFSLPNTASPVGVVGLELVKDAPASSLAAGITLSDVLDSLKIYLGKSLPSSVSSPYNLVAADFDANGKVELTDVLALLKFYLGKTSAVSVKPSWAFVDTTDYVQSDTAGGVKVIASDGLALSKTDALPHAIDHDFSMSTAVEIIGVLRGDVDGSWSV